MEEKHADLELGKEEKEESAEGSQTSSFSPDQFSSCACLCLLVLACACSPSPLSLASSASHRELLYYVSQSNEAKIREVINEKKANVNCKDRGEEVDEEEAKADEEEDLLHYVYKKITEDSPLHIAASIGQAAIAKALFFFGAKVEQRNRYGVKCMQQADRRALLTGGCG